MKHLLEDEKHRQRHNENIKDWRSFWRKRNPASCPVGNDAARIVQLVTLGSGESLMERPEVLVCHGLLWCAHVWEWRASALHVSRNQWINHSRLLCLARVPNVSRIPPVLGFAGVHSKQACAYCISHVMAFLLWYKVA